MRAERLVDSKTIRSAWPLAARAAVTGVFLVAAVGKIVGFSQFEGTIRASYLLPDLLTVPAAVLVLALELFAAIGLWIPRSRRLALQAASLLACVFLAYAGRRWFQHITVPCDCFGTLFKIPPAASALIDVALLAVSQTLLASEFAPSCARQIRQKAAGMCRLLLPNGEGTSEFKRSEGIMLAGMFVLSLALFVAALIHGSSSRHAREAALLASTLKATPAEVIGPNREFYGSPRSPYTLVEFGDYQCPPCRAAGRRIPALLKRYQGKVRLAFRNLPLTNIHPYALPAALAAEAAREQGRFWPMHDALYSSPLDAGAITAIARRLGLNMIRFRRDQSTGARAEVETDTKAAAALGVRSTPSFLLCCPNGQVLRLGRLVDLPDAMDAEGSAERHKGRAAQ